MNEAVTKVIDMFTQEWFLWGLPEVDGTVQQVHCSRRRLLRRGLEFHVFTLNKSAHTKKSLETYLMILVIVILSESMFIFPFGPSSSPSDSFPMLNGFIAMVI